MQCVCGQRTSPLMGHRGCKVWIVWFGNSSIFNPVRPSLSAAAAVAWKCVDMARSKKRVPEYTDRRVEKKRKKKVKAWICGTDGGSTKFPLGYFCKNPVHVLEKLEKVEQKTNSEHIVSWAFCWVWRSRRDDGVRTTRLLTRGSSCGRGTKATSKPRLNFTCNVSLVYRSRVG